MSVATALQNYYPSSTLLTAEATCQYGSEAFDFFGWHTQEIDVGAAHNANEALISTRSQSTQIKIDLPFQVGFFAPSHEGARVAAVQRLYREIESYLALESGWDGYDADDANKGSIQEARVFIAALPSQYKVPKSTIASDGEISLYWAQEDRYLEASFPGDGTYHYIYSAPGERFGSPDIAVTIPTINPEFVSYLSAI